MNMKTDKIFKLVASRFALVDYNDDWRHFSKPFYHFVNENYKGGETIIVKTGPKKILNFLQKLYEINPEYWDYVREFELRYWVGNEFRGWGGDVSKLVVDKDFANKIELKGYYEWIDRAWGDYYAELTYDFKNLKGGTTMDWRNAREADMYEAYIDASERAMKEDALIDSVVEQIRDIASEFKIHNIKFEKVSGDEWMDVDVVVKDRKTAQKLIDTFGGSIEDYEGEGVMVLLSFLIEEKHEEEEESKEEEEKEEEQKERTRKRPPSP